jgi:hypothetical protein
VTPAQWERTHHVLRAVFGVPDYDRIAPPSYARGTHCVTGAPMVTLQYGDIGRGSRTGDILETCGVGFGDSDAAARRDAFDRVRDGIVDHFAQRWAWALEDAAPTESERALAMECAVATEACRAWSEKTHAVDVTDAVNAAAMAATEAAWREADRQWERALGAVGDLDAILAESSESEGSQ